MDTGVYGQFDTLPVEHAPPVCPKAGAIHLYEWNEDSKRDDWRACYYCAVCLFWKQYHRDVVIKYILGYSKRTFV